MTAMPRHAMEGEYAYDYYIELLERQDWEK